jgi:predicted nucleic acid-binding protein
LFWDTSTLVDYLRAVPAAVHYFEQIRGASGRPYCSVITEAEIWAGNRNNEEELRAAAALYYFTVIPVDTDVARLAGNLLNAMSRNQIKAHFGDAIIAASAIQQDETILTADAASQRTFGHRVNYQVYRP